MEYRASFFLMAGMMFINNLMWLFSGAYSSSRFPIVNNWELHDVMMMWAIGAGGFGWANMLFGNFHRIALIVASGQLDVYLSQPKPVLLHVMASRMSLTAAGDFVFGLAVYVWVGNHSVTGLLLFCLALLISGLVYGSYDYCRLLLLLLGNAEGIAQQVFNGFLALTTYPSDIFRGITRILLFTVIPAGFISYLPIGLLRDFDPPFAVGAIGMTVFLVLAGVIFFHAGLRRYTSGNAIAMRS